jgi:DNA-binding transcriptional ArsR family regulator
MEAFTAIADPVRRGIVDRLAEGEKSAGELGGGFGISQPAVSKHLRVLREAGLVVARAQGQRRVYRLNPAPLERVDSWLARYRRLWEDRIDSLRSLVEAEQGATNVTVTGTRYPGGILPKLAGWNAGCWRRPRASARPSPVDLTAA